MAYVSSDSSAIGTKLEVDIRGTRTIVEVTKLPFYKRSAL
jgi:glycine cleavage system aminomethyltransferase T